MAGIASPFGGGGGGFIPPGSPGSPEASSSQSESQGMPGQVDAMMGGASIPAPDPNEHLRAIMRQYRQVEQMIDGLAAASGPETAPMARVIKMVLQKMRSKAIERPGMTPEPAAPQTMA